MDKISRLNLNGQMGPILYYGLIWTPGDPTITNAYRELGLDTDILDVPWAIPQEQQARLPRNRSGDMIAELLDYNPSTSPAARTFLKIFSPWRGKPAVPDSTMTTIKCIPYMARSGGFYDGLFPYEPESLGEKILLAGGSIPLKIVAGREYSEGLLQGNIVRAIVLHGVIDDLFKNANH